MEIRVRDAAISDIPYIEELERCCFSNPWPYETIRTQIESKGHIFLIAENNGVPAGYMGLQHVIDEGYISDVASAPEYRRAGIASKLIEEMILRGKELGLSFLTLEVRENNTAARQLYMKHGFEVVGKRRNYYAKPVEDAVLMTMLLK